MASTNPLKAIIERIIEQKKAQGVDIMKKPKKVKEPKPPRKKKLN